MTRLVASYRLGEAAVAIRLPRPLSATAVIRLASVIDCNQSAPSFQRFKETHLSNCTAELHLVPSFELLRFPLDRSTRNAGVRRGFAVAR
jgi:hypothetical protein